MCMQVSVLGGWKKAWDLLELEFLDAVRSLT